MIYRFDILANSGLYEAWAHDSKEAEANFKRDMQEPCFVYFSGGAPRNLNFKQWAYVLGICDGNVDRARVFDKLFGDIYPIVKGMN